MSSHFNVNNLNEDYADLTAKNSSVDFFLHGHNAINTPVPAASSTLTANIQYLQGGAGSATHTLPTAETSSTGDEIVIWYQVGVTAGQTQSYKCATGETLSAASVLVKGDVGATNFGVIVLVPATTNNQLNIVGLANGGAGVGTHLRFYFDGLRWAVVANDAVNGTGALESTSVFVTA